jgi:transposase-like protein
MFSCRKATHSGGFFVPFASQSTIFIFAYANLLLSLQQKVMNCSKCGSTNHCKDGVINGRQRYKCKDCQYHYTVAGKSDVKTNGVKRQAFELYLEGLGFRATGRFLHISYGTVYQWITQWKRHLELPDRNGNISVVEPDKMHTYMGRKKLLLDMDCC